MNETILEEEASDAVPRAARVSLRPKAEQSTSERTVSESVTLEETPLKVELSPSMQLRMRAAQLLREKGWCQGFSSDINGRHCLIGALAVVWQEIYARTGDGWDEMAKGRVAWQAATFELGGQEKIPYWND